MIDTFFDALREGHPIYWGGFLIAILILFRFLKGLGKFALLLVILAAIAYTIFYFNPKFFGTLWKKAQDVTKEIGF